MSEQRGTVGNKASKFEVAVIATHVAPAKGFGGVAESTAALVRSWRARGAPFVFCSSDASHGASLTPGDVGLGPLIPVRLYHAYLFRRWGFGLGAFWKIFRTCSDARVAYINGIATWPTTIGALACILLGRPFVASLRAGLMPEHVAFIRRNKPHKWLYYRLITLPTLKFARAIHATSPIEAAGARPYVGGTPVVVVPNGIDFTAWPMTARKGANKPLTFLYLGRFSPEKGLRRFLEIWLDLREEGEKFILAGDGEGSYADEVKKLAAHSKGMIECHGYVAQDKVRTLMGASDFLVLPSGLEGGERENFGNSVAEALATGLPVMVSRGLAWDAVEKGNAGFLFSRDVPSIHDALEKARGMTPLQYADMSRQGRRYIETGFDLEDTSRHLWSLLESVAHGQDIFREQLS